ncbi:hypothetical protein GF380_06520 [Candidatus Uhrbacteria bacterium]|nr:hypothetical protein [Candidatus Uhrbacteria bacterium]MBD3284588.1 hypothetical protein [Candidatus Uhrbacteria bacterium]
MIKRLVSILFVSAMAVLATTPGVHALEIDYDRSRVSADKDQVEADNIDSATVTVKVTDGFGIGIPDVQITLNSSRGVQDTLEVIDDTTNLFGQARFRVKSLFKGTSTYSAKIGDQPLDDVATVTYVGGLALDLEAGDLIKIPDDGDPNTQSDTAVYYYAIDGKRYVFPNEKTYFSWYPDFTKVNVIPLEQMSFIPIGGNVTYKPGTRLIKFQTDIKTYAVARGGVLRWLKTEEAARKFYGDNWNKEVDDVPESFYVNYTFGTPILEVDYYFREREADRSQTIDQDKGLEEA